MPAPVGRRGRWSTTVNEGWRNGGNAQIYGRRWRQPAGRR
ncbi:hypothetical protein A2U01_0106879, partial [Trifolium medium]|nr:hypothetical protein [Trifolium medium]